jgi:NAD(P)-dependent dehydrogenase (short-subunit alcohol dehydrogenase family)
MQLPHEVAVIGAGTMGAGIARVFADAGASVRISARREQSFEAARERLGDSSVLATTSLDQALEGAELVIETGRFLIGPGRHHHRRRDEDPRRLGVRRQDGDSLSRLDEEGLLRPQPTRRSYCGGGGPTRGPARELRVERAPRR